MGDKKQRVRAFKIIQKKRQQQRRADQQAKSKKYQVYEEDTVVDVTVEEPQTSSTYFSKGIEIGLFGEK